MTLGILSFHFQFSSIEYSVSLNTIPDSMPLRAFCKDLNSMGLNYQTYYRIINRPKDKGQKTEARIYMPFLFDAFSVAIRPDYCLGVFVKIN